MNRSRHVCAVLAALVLALGACTSDPAPADPVGVPEGALSAKAPEPAQRCHKSGNVVASNVAFKAEDGTPLSGVTFGTGARGVLLLPQRGVDLCGWWDYAIELTGQGFQALAIDFRGTGFSDDADPENYVADAIAAVAQLRKTGAQKVVIVGASIGAATALVTAGRIPDQVAGVVALSNPDGSMDVTGGAGPNPHTPNQAAPLITAPLMLAYATGDSSAAKPDALAEMAKGPAKQIVGRPGVSHGWDMVKVGPDDVRPELLAFLQSYA